MVSNKIWILVLLGFLASASLVKGVAEVEGDYDEYPEDRHDSDDEDGHQPVITSLSSVIDVDEGEDIRLECKGEHLDDYALIWTKLPDKIISAGGVTLSNNDTSRIESHEKETVLLIKNSTVSDSGIYNCTVQWNVTIVHHVTVREKEMKSKPPHITLRPAGSHVVDEDNNINLTCRVATDGKQLDFYWEKKNQQGSMKVNVDDTVISRTAKSRAENKLMLKSVSRHQAGDYVCVFRDDIGKAESTVRLDVNFPPIIETRHDSIHAILGKTAELRCIVRAQPKPEVFWYKSAKGNQSLWIPITNGPAHRLSSAHHSHILSLISVTENDYGQYTCQATNGFSKVAVAHIEVTGKPSQPTIVEDKTKLGEEHMSYDLVWKIESSIPIDTGILRYKKESDPQWTDVNVEAKRSATQPAFYEVSYTLKNLTASSTYEAMVLASNKYGWSTESRLHRFSINGKSYTDTLELNDGKGKALGVSGNSFLVTVSISVFLLFRRW